MESTEPVVLAADMPEDRQEAVIAICKEAVAAHDLESDAAAYIKKAVEALDSPTWHCVVGISFGSLVAHTRDHFLHIKLHAPELKSVKSLHLGPESDWCNVLVFKTA